MASIMDIMAMSVSERKSAYAAVGIDKVIIGAEIFTDYSAFSFFWEKSYVKSPVRSGDGSITNLDSYATFLTPHLKIDFSLMSIDDYRRVMNLIYSGNEYTVTCYDITSGKITTNNMYFATEEMPKAWAIARELNGEEWVELAGIQDYTVEMIGTNNYTDELSISYDLNLPSYAFGKLIFEGENPVKGQFYVVGNGVYVEQESGINKIPIEQFTFSDPKGNTHALSHWSTNKNDQYGFNYLNGDTYVFRNDTVLYAIWG
jgi:GTPase SAR1 family protein